ncbi:hypothetical protein [Thermofilum pendens]|uniref:Uncharacterized protein n=1 Tax=Thermofilum pendens (strain DSM 2475 / Hrk 5) TaxID=368408 RepID=A1RY45_THEPD|nr:hypothetical protein [Thermofilum pendens]ABL78125.1 hypothetical protein Tpen_0723 [Thermofilum pendens Hrk 5]
MEALTAAVGAGLYAAVGLLYWFLGRRSESLRFFEDAALSAAFVVVVHVILGVSSQIATLAGVQLNLWSSADVSACARRASETFWEASRKAVDTVLFVEAERALLASTPVTSPLASVLGGATGWSTAELGIVAIVYMHLSFAAEAFSIVSPYLFAFGAALMPIPRLRRLGASLLSIYLSTAIAMAYSLQVTSDALRGVRVPSASSPLDWVNVAGVAGENAVLLGKALTLTSLAFALATVGGVGLASAFDSVFVGFVRV